MHPEVSLTPLPWAPPLLPALLLPPLMLSIQLIDMTESAMQEWHGAYGDSAPLCAPAVV